MASPRRCRATPATVRPNDTTQIKANTAFSTSENSTCSGDPTRLLRRMNNGKPKAIDPTHWTTLLRVDHWTQA